MSIWSERGETSDPWSYFDYKETFKNQSEGSMGWIAPSWIGDNRRRLAAYHFLDDICKNQGSRWMNQEVSEEDRKDHREYGDPGMHVLTIASSVLGDKQSIVVDGLLEEADQVSGPKKAQQDLYNEWALKERFLIKLASNEKKAVKLGDMVYTLGWNAIDERPRLRTYDPGFYFPVLDDWTHDDDYPRKVHIAWEYERPDEPGGKAYRYLRRISWWLEETETPQQYPWNAKEVSVTCIMDEREWLIDNLRNTTLYDLSDAGSIVIIEPVDMGIDFIPVVHIPNIPDEDEHFGVSSLALGCQAFDDLAATDTDLQAAATTVGSPPLGLDEGSMPASDGGEIATYGPSQVFTGKISIPDTSKSLDALLKLEEAILDRLAVNLRTPNTLIGRVDPSKVESGIILTLSFQPHSNMIREMRLVRQDKYNLLLKFVGRFYMLAGQMTVLYPVHLEFGSYLPADRTETSSIVNAGITGKWMSLETAVLLLVQAGYPIEDAKIEVSRIVQSDFKGAKEMLEATADIDAVRARLGLPPLPEEFFEEEGDDALGNGGPSPTGTPPGPPPPA